ncbi:MAG: 16S rRNA (adenine(1518)-N(6)/adenine(1519)-N(6))-dimethyltransferase RsmA [Gammaproteobacteria bacterium]
MRIQPKKNLGQHFLRDKNIIGKIVAAIAPQASDHIVEIGPGLGALTQALLPHIDHLAVVEFDRDLIAPLKELCEGLGALTIYHQDVLQFDFEALKPASQSLRIVGNLPYQISTPLLFYLIQYVTWIKDLHFMLQKEVVDRLAAKPGSKAYGRLSVMIQYHFKVQALFSVSRMAFHPPPQVESAVVRLIPQSRTLPANDYAHFSELVKQAFNHRRKTLANSLKGEVATEQFAQAGIDLKARPETLSVDDFVRLSNCSVHTKI